MPNAPGPVEAPPATRIDHVGIVVSDVARSIDWYADVMDAERAEPVDVPGTTLRVAFVSVGNAQFELIQNLDRSDRAFDRSNNDVGAFHSCIHVPDVEAAYARLVEHGGRSSGPPEELIPGVFSFYFRDPDGVQFQAIQMGEGTGGRTGVRYGDGLHHIAITVGDLDRSLEWYGRTFGLPEGVRSTREGDIPSRTFEVPGSRYRQSMVPIGRGFVEIMEWQEPRGRPYDLTMRDVGSGHVCLEVEDPELVHAIAERHGDDIRVPLKQLPDGRTTFFVADPDGLLVQAVGR